MNKSKAEQRLVDNMYNKAWSWEDTFDVRDVLERCIRLRQKLATLNRRLQRTRTENKRLQKHNQELLNLVLEYQVHQNSL